MRGLIIKGIGGFYYVKTSEGTYECKARGLFRKDNEKPYIGDYVEINPGENYIGTIRKIHPRKNFLLRPPISNITQNIIVAAVKHPPINYFFLNNILIYSEAMGINNVLLFNKTDQMSEDEREEIIENFKSTDYSMLFTSAEEGIGIDVLREVLRGHTTVFSGASGVGKSSLLNKLTDENVKTGELSNKIERGKHTTRHVELFEIGEGTYLADTPGFSNIQVDIIKDIVEEDLMNYFPEFLPHLGSCKFNSCLHHKEPKCAVKQALKDGLVSHVRYESYITLLEQISQIQRY